jgi:hypothetical protein
MTRDDQNSGSFPTPAIAKRNSQPESLNLDDVDLSRDGVQGDVTVTKRPASTFVSRRVPAYDEK